MTANPRVDPDPPSRPRSRSLLPIALAIAGVLLGLGLFFGPRSTPDSETLRQEASKAARDGRWLEAESALSRISDPTDADRLLRAVVATSLDRPDAALEFLARIPADGPLSARIALVTSRAELGRFRARPMEAALRRALQLDPKLAEARRSLVYLYGVQGRRVELLEQFQALADQGPLTFTLVHHWCIAHQEQIKEPADLKPTLERFLANDPDDRWSRIGLARVYRRLGLFDRSKECLSPLPETDPDARAARAEVEFDRGDIDAVTALVAEGPTDHPRLARLRGQVALSRNEGPSAVRFFRISDAAEPNHGETLYGLAQALRMVGDKAAAEPYARQVAAQRAFRDHLMKLTDTQDSKAAQCFRLGSECETSGYLPEARSWYRLAIVADPFQVQAQEALHRLTPAGSSPATATPGDRPSATS